MPSLLGKTYVSFLLKHIQKKAAAVITVSENTKKNLLEFLPNMSPDRIFVTHEAASTIFKKIDNREKLEETKTRHRLRLPFVLFVGSLKTHKNIPTLIKALANLREKKGVVHELVLVGRPDPRNSGLLSLINQNSFVRHFSELKDEELVCLLYQLILRPDFA